MNKFICLGAHNGDMVRVLDKLDTLKILGKNYIVWDEIHLFEPQPQHADKLLKLQEQDKRVIYHPKAAYIKDGEMTFYIKNTLGGIGSTLDKGKTTGGTTEMVVVQTIDFIKWIEDTTTQEDFIFLDMDIECSEYYILPKLITSTMGDRINFLSVEWHDGKSTTWVNKEDSIKEDVNHYFGNRVLDHDLTFKGVLSH
jgi:FkbM family methyltransferase